MRFEALQQLVDRIKRETDTGLNKTSKRIATTQDHMFSQGAQRHHYDDGLRKCLATLRRLAGAKKGGPD